MQSFLNRKTQKAISICCICVLVIIGLFALVSLYYFAFHPFLSLYVYPEPTPHTGAKFFENKEHLDCPYGKDFDSIVSTLGILELGEVADFYYRDNRPRDNPIGGNEVPDIYAVDIKIGIEEFTNTYNKLSSKIQSNCEIQNFELFVLPANSISAEAEYNDKVVIIALNDNSHILRCIMIAPTDEFSLGYITTHTNLNWQ